MKRIIMSITACVLLVPGLAAAREQTYRYQGIVGLSQRAESISGPLF
jgi:hypothetical protein